MSFRVLLWCIGALLRVATRLDARLRAQITRDLTVVIDSRDGVARSFLFRDRLGASRSGVAEQADLRLTFPEAAMGVRMLLAPDAVHRITRGLASRTLTLEGQPTHLLWFYELVMAHAPWRRRPHQLLPGGYVAPDPNGKVAGRITREPVAAELDPAWSDAHRQREKIVMWQVARGAPSAGAIPGYRHVVDAPMPDTEDHS